MTPLKEGNTETADREIIITRIVHAPRELVFEVYTNPKHVAKWWGPAGFKNTIHKMDVRPGGVWELTMHGPDGTDYPNFIKFVKVDVPTLVMYHHGSFDNDPDMFEVTITFDKEKGDKTKITMIGLFKSKQARDLNVETYGAIEGGNQTMDRLEAYLKNLNPDT